MSTPSSQKEPAGTEKSASSASAATGSSLPPAVAIVLAGVIGGLVVAGGLWAAGYLVARDVVPEAVGQRIAAVEKQVKTVAARPAAPAIDVAKLDERAKRLAAVEKAVASPQAAASDAALDKRVTAVEGEGATLNSAVAALRKETEALSKTVAQAGRAARDAATQAGTAASLARANQPTVGRDDIENLTKRIATLEQSIKTNFEAIRSERAEHSSDAAASKAVRLALVAGAMREAVLRGEPYGADLNVAKSLAADPAVLAPLEPFAASGVPTAAALGRELVALVPALSEAATPGIQSDNFLERLQANAERLVRVRPVDAPAGDAPDKVLARINAAADHADIDGALAALAELPANVRARAEAWIKKAKGRNAAIAASRAFDAAALGALARANQGAPQ